MVPNYAAQVRRGGKLVRLGSFAKAEEAALCIARSPEGQEAAKGERRGRGGEGALKRVAPLTREEARQRAEEARQQARVEGLVLLEAETTETNSAGYFGVRKVEGCTPYVAQVRRGRKVVHLGSFAAAEEAALCIARSPEGQAAAAKLDTEVFSEACFQLAASALRLQLDLNNSTG